MVEVVRIWSEMLSFSEVAVEEVIADVQAVVEAVVADVELVVNPAPEEEPPPIDMA